MLIAAQLQPALAEHVLLLLQRGGVGGQKGVAAAQPEPALAEQVMLLCKLRQRGPLACIGQQWPRLKTLLSFCMGPHGQLAVCWRSASGLLAVCRAGVWTMQGCPPWHWPVRDPALVSHLLPHPASAAVPAKLFWVWIAVMASCLIPDRSACTGAAS